MAHFGVKVTPQIQGAEVAAEDLQKIIQAELDKATERKPITVSNFKAKVTGKQAKEMRSVIQNALGTATTKNPIQVTGFIAKVSAKERDAMLKTVREKMENAGVVLKIKEINANSAVERLRKDLEKMLSGLQITGLKEFVGTDGMTAAMEKAADSAERQAEALERSQKAVKGIKANTQMLSNLKLVTSSISRGLFGIADENERADMQAQAAQILKDIEAAASKAGDEQERLIELITQSVQRLRDQADAQKESQKSEEARAAAVKKAGGEEAYQAAQRKKEDAAREAAEKKEIANQKQIIALKSKLQTWIQKNQKAYLLNKDAVDGLMAELQNESTLTTVELAKIDKKLSDIIATSKTAGVTGSSFFQKLIAGWEKFGGWSIVTKTMMAAWRTVKDMFSAVVELDSAMTELRKVTDLTEASYAKFKNTAAGMAREIGASMADTINATADFSRLGFDLEGATALAEAALVYKNVGDGIDDISVASESLISTIKAFSEIAPEDAMSIVDKFNEVGNSFAISSVGIGDALQRSAATLAGAGNTIDQSIGMITAMNEIVQDPDVVGTAMKTLSLYLRAAKVDAEEAGIATDGMANSVSELRNDILALTGQRVDIMIDESTFKSTYQIMKELSEVWGTLTDIDQAAILELIGGKRNANTISSLLMNFETAIAATESAADSLGSAMRENEKYIDSINGRLNQLKASFEAFSDSVINSGLVKAIISIATGFLDVLTVLNEFHMLLPLIVAGFSAIHNIGLSNIFGSLTASIAKAVPALSGLMTMLQTVTGTLTSRIGAGALSFKALFAGIPGKISAVTAALAACMLVIKGFNMHQQKLVDQANEVKDAYADSQKTYQSNIDTLDGLRARYDALAEGVDENGKNISLTASEYAEYRDIIEQVADISPSLIKGYDEEGVALKNYTDIIRAAKEEQKALAEAEKDAYLASGNTLFKGNKKLYRDAQSDMYKAGGNLGDALGVVGFNNNQHIWRKALDGIGVDLDINEVWGSLTAEDFEKIYENADHFMFLIREEAKKTETYSNIEIKKIENAITNLGSAWSSLSTIKKEESQFLIETLMNDSSDILQSKINTLPVAMLDELKVGLTSVVDPLISYDENLASAVLYVQDLANIVGSDAGKSLTEMASGLADGSVSIEEYNAAVAALGEEWANNPALSVAIAFFEGFSNSAKKAGEDVKFLNTEVASLSSTLKASKQNQDILNQALDEMNSAGGISNDTLSAIEGLLAEEEKLTDYITLQNGKLTLNEQAWKDRNAAMWQKDLDGLINQNTLLGEENKALEAHRTAAQAYIDQGDMYNPSEHGGYEWKSTDEAKIALEGYTKQIELNTTAQRENWQEYTLRQAAMRQEGVEIKDVVGEIQSATTLAKNASDAIIDARSDLDKYGKLQPETISAISSILGEEAANIKDYVGEAGEAFNEDLFKGFVEGKIGEYGAEIDVVRDSLIEMLNVDTSTNPFDAITTAMENVRKAASIYESAQQDMLSDSGMLSEGTITALQALFEEDWLSYVEEVPDGKGYTLLGNKLTQFAQTELTTANATEALLATMMALFVDLPDTTKLDQVSRALNGIGQAGNLASTIATELAENGTNSLNTLSSLIDFVGNDFVDNMGEYVTFTDKGFELSANAVEAYATKMIDDLVGVDDELKKLYKDRLEDAVKTQVEIAKIASTIGNVSGVGGLIHNIHQELSEDGTNSLDTLASFIEAYGEGWEAQVDWTNGIEISTSALRDNIVEQIEATAKTEDQKDAMIDALDATIALEKANESLSESYSGIKNVISSIGSMGGGAEIGIDLYEQMIAQDKRYAAAVEYQNGVMTINRDLFDQVTAQIIKETQARALQQIALLETDERYQELIEKQKEFALTDEELGYVNGIEAQIMGWGILAQEIENANSALNRFMNADNEAGASSYNQAKAAAEMIDNVLHNKKSEWYGREGEEKYLEAKNFLIRPDIDMSLAEKSIKRYVTDDNSGINHFINDLIKFDFMEVTDNGAMMVDVNLEAIAKKLNLTVEGVRALIDEYNTFGEQKIEVTPSVDTGDVEGGTEKTSALMTTAQNAKQALADVNAEGELIKTKITEIGDMSLTVNASPANNAVSGLIDNLSGVINKINAINNMRISISASTSTGSSLLGGITSLFSGGSYGTSAAGGTEASSGGKTLVGEVGPEIVVDPSKNRWYVVGKNGAEFVMLPKNAIVFDAAQSGKLLKSGKAGGYGEAMASGSFDPTKIPGYYDKDEDIDFVDTRKQNVTINNDIDVVSSAAPTTQQVLDAIGDVVNGTGLKTNVGTSTKKKTSGSGSSSSSSSAKEEKTELEKLQEKYEEINSLTEHLIEHQEHLYSVAEKGMDLGAMEKSLEEQARLYRQIMEDSQKAVSDMRAAGATDADEELQAMEEAYWSAYESLYDTLDQINSLYVDSLNDKIDSIQGAYDTLKQAADEFSSDGGISVDTFQKLLENGVQYMDCLEKVNGQYIINEEAIQKMIAAEKDQLAVETALSYLNQVKEAIQDGEYDRLSNLTDMTNQMGDATWRAVFAQAELLNGNGLDDEQYQIVINNLNAIKDLANTVITDVGEGSSGLREQQESAFEKIINYVQELIKYETKEQIEAIEEQIDAYKKVIDLKKEALKTAKDENDYTKSVAEKTKEIAEIQARIDQLSLDSSRSAQAERIKLMEELAALQDELGETQEDHAYDLQIDALDKQAEAYEESRQPEIDALENSISSAEKLYQLALDRVETGWDTLYGELIAWNTEAGNVLNEEIVANWEKAIEAAQTYGSVAGALGEFIIPGTEASRNNVVADTNLPKYHKGGVVGNEGEINEDEVVAILEKGEIVINDGMKKTLYKIIDFASYLSEKLGTAIGHIQLPSIVPSAVAKTDMISAMPTSGNTSNVFSPSIQVSINHSGQMTDRDALSYGKRIANTAMEQLRSAFEQRGMNAPLSTLRP